MSKKINFAKLLSDLRRDEGEAKSGGKHVAYKDHLGYWTIGIGRLIDKRRGGGLSDDEADYLLYNDINHLYDSLCQNLPWLLDHPEKIQRALCNMGFQLGVAGLLKFKNTLALIKAGSYEAAADNALKSKWARQTPNRAKRVTDLIRNANIDD